jgi:hypothetical protein
LALLLVVLSQFSLGQFLGVGKIAAKAFMFKIEAPEAPEAPEAQVRNRRVEIMIN